MLNDRVERVQVGRYKDVPLETNGNLWLIWYYHNGSWDSDTISGWREIVKEIETGNVKELFCVWHGSYRTNLFLMDKKDFIKRVKKAFSK
ncbi:hypothetical protein K9L67_06035 [Candidatus Woesearchaeota archaeon]|nr:hypothetical protein [Candidatus Woesearchaeota archaeon]MCF7901753.1 hypothetical protein [Candidatus Woesearchaeota archaeon]MCF8013178.1 hypothetical protein [Candidatus Woesearchaeota archaeon]